MQLWQKENVLIIIGIICLILWLRGKQIKNNKTTQELSKWLPIVGGLAFAFNTLLQIS